jgi:putative copper export protein/methionine-rich copper-binding protein CopC
MKRLPLLLLFSLLICLLAPAQPTSAHGYIVRSIPGDRATLERAPVRVQYWFSEGLEPDFSSITVRDAEGATIATGGVDPDNNTLLAARLPTNLPDGAYVAELRIAFASDGHVIVETRVFFVGAQVAGVAGSLAQDVVIPLEVAWRTTLLGALILLFGTFTLYSGVLVPAWGNPRYPAGLLAPRIMWRLNGLVGVALVLAFVASIVALLQQTMVFFGAPLDRVIAQNLWNVVRIGSRFGDVWNARMLMLALTAALFGTSLYLRSRQPETVRAFWVANTWLGALILGTISVGSHAAGSPFWPWAAIGADWAHTLAVGFWAGGLAALVFVLPPALSPLTGDTRRAALLAVLRRFSPLAVASVGVVIGTGIYSATTWVRAPEQANSAYGLTLGLKLLLALALLVLGAAHNAALHPERYARWSGLVGRFSGFIRTLRLEALLVLLVIGAAALLGSTPPPRPADADTQATAPTVEGPLAETFVHVALTPGGPGINSYDVVVTRAGLPVDNARVHLRFADPSRDWRGEWHTAENVGDGLYAATGDDLSRTGPWWLLVDVDGAQTAYTLDVTEDVAALVAFAPMPVNVLALGAVLLALGFAAYPRARRFYNQLDLRPVTVAVAVAAVLFTGGIIAAAAVGMQAVDEQNQTLYNRPPQVVNSTLPDNASVTRGVGLLAARCPGWSDSPGLTNLAQNLPRLRDEDLYTALAQGWRSLPSCDADLTEAERWDVVNAVRTLELERAA